MKKILDPRVLQSTYSRLRGVIHGCYYVDYDGIQYPFAKQYIIDGGAIDERVKRGKPVDDFPSRQIRQFFQPSDTVLDIGAYIGTHSIPLALLGGVVHAFEASPLNAPRLRAICHRLPQIHVHEVAVGNRTDSVLTHFPDCTGPESHQQTIRYVVYDDYVREADIADPAFVKMDIEGMETVALFGMTHLVETVRPIWHLEYHPESRPLSPDHPGFLSPEEGGYNLNRKFTELGYVIFELRHGEVKPVETMTRHELYYLIPEEKMSGITI